MKRLIEYTVFSGLVTACRLATCPTRRSPPLVMATTDGVVRPPSWLGITTGSPPCITATTELVVPRSIPIILLIASFSFPNLPETLVLRSPGDCPAILIDARGACSDRTRIRPSSGVQTAMGNVERTAVYRLSVTLSSYLISPIKVPFAMTYRHLSYPFPQYSRNLRFVSELAPSSGFSSTLEKTARLNLGRGNARIPWPHPRQRG